MSELEHRIEKGKDYCDAGKVKAAETPQARLDEVPGSDDHKGCLGNMDPAERAERKQAAGATKARYGK